MEPTKFLRLSPRREMVLALALGAVGAALVLLAVRQDWAHVRIAAPPPLPGSDAPVTGQDLVPAAAALAVAVLASLAAVVATRKTARKLVGLALAVLGAGIAAVVSLRVTAADVIAAAAGSAGSPVPAGSVSAGGAQGGGAPPIAGFAAHVAMTATAWRLLAVAGSAAVVAAGLLAIWRGSRWPVMSSRFDPPQRARPRPSARNADPVPADPVVTGPAAGRGPVDPAASGAGTAGPVTTGPAAVAETAHQVTANRRPDAGDSASLWESLSRGEDPTDG